METEMDTNNILAEARHLTKEYPAGRGRKVHAVTDVSFTICEGETLGIVGESGCGKSTLGNMIVNLVAPTSGELFLRGEKVTGLSDRDYLRFRRQVQLIFQDTYASLDPRMTVRDIIAEPLETWHLCPDAQSTTAKVLEVMEAVGYSDVSAFAVNFTLGSFIPLVKIGNAFAYVAAALCFPLLLKLTQTLCSK